MNITKGKIAKAQKVVFYGPEGIGKSTFAAQFPEPLFIDTEGSTNNMDVARMDKPTSWTMLQQQVQYVKQNPATCKTLIIDTIDWAEQLCITHVCAIHDKKGIEDFGYGNGYVYVKEELGRFLNLLSDVTEVGVNVVLTAHAQIRKFEQPDELGAYDRYELKLGKKTSSQTAPLVKEWADMVLFANYKTFVIATDKEGKKNKAQGGSRVIYTQHHPAWDAKNRHDLPYEMPLEFSQIAHIFNSPVQQEINQPNNTAQPNIQSEPIKTESNPNINPSQNLNPNPITEPTLNPNQNLNSNPIQIDDNIPNNLKSLMIQNQVTTEEIQQVVSEKGYYPKDTPIPKYDPNFIEGVLVSAWNQVYNYIQESRKYPF